MVNPGRPPWELEGRGNLRSLKGMVPSLQISSTCLKSAPTSEKPSSGRAKSVPRALCVLLAHRGLFALSPGEALLREFSPSPTFPVVCHVSTAPHLLRPHTRALRTPAQHHSLTTALPQDAEDICRRHTTQDQNYVTRIHD